MPQPKTHPAEIQIQDYQYNLPDTRIARFPLKERDQSKLLLFKDKNIQEDCYKNLADHLPQDSLLLFNQAKVVHARLSFQKVSGGKIEIFCLEPDQRYSDITTAMMQERQVYWKCLLKGASKWKSDSPLFLNMEDSTSSPKNKEVQAKAEKINREGNTFTIRFSWQTTRAHPLSFSEFLEIAGEIPIPPYLKRKAESSDQERYQTIFAKKEGSVAAPTAGLHFTEPVIAKIKAKSIAIEKLTLHVSAGTFMPVKTEKMKGHQMHSEWIELSLSLLKRVAQQIRDQKKVITVGTTSARTLESAYWIGAQILRNEWNTQTDIAVSQWYPYRQPDEFTGLEAIEALIAYFDQNEITKLITRTQLIIAPGYEFKLLDGLITNFHQPASTLLLMIAALVGDHWKSIYKYALQHDFRFLSYGDGSLLWKDS